MNVAGPSCLVKITLHLEVDRKTRIFRETSPAADEGPRTEILCNKCYHSATIS